MHERQIRILFYFYNYFFYIYLYIFIACGGDTDLIKRCLKCDKSTCLTCKVTYAPDKNTGECKGIMIDLFIVYDLLKLKLKRNSMYS